MCERLLSRCKSMSMRKVIGIGETVFDIILQGGEPKKAIPGGSTLNAVLSVARAGIPASFVSEVGKDRLGRQIIEFLSDNGVDTKGVNCIEGRQSPLSLAFLDESNNADYLFYQGVTTETEAFMIPEIAPDDIVIFGSYFALNPRLRTGVADFLQTARDKGAILYYDINFRKAYRNERLKLRPALIENIEMAHMVRAGREDLEVLYGNKSPEEVYRQDIAFYHKPFVFTDGARPVKLFVGSKEVRTYAADAVETVSTIGAGDSFNAGMACSLIGQGITRRQIEEGIDGKQWDELVKTGMAFGKDVCRHIDNYISTAFGEAEKQRRNAATI